MITSLGNVEDQHIKNIIKILIQVKKLLLCFIICKIVIHISSFNKLENIGKNSLVNIGKNYPKDWKYYNNVKNLIVDKMKNSWWWTKKGRLYNCFVQ